MSVCSVNYDDNDEEMDEKEGFPARPRSHAVRNLTNKDGAKVARLIRGINQAEKRTVSTTKK